MWRLIATWPFGIHAVASAAPMLAAGGTALDAVETGIRTVEAGNFANTVGLYGAPNRDGDVELDAAIMDGRTLQLGAVAAVRKFLHPVSIARKVLERTSHSLLVGPGAEQFALAHGFIPEVHATGGTTACNDDDTGNHDTVCLIAIDMHGDVAVATSTSGLAGKLPGRVGDTPLVGSGFYADNEVGAVAATGVGESIMRGCLSIQALNLMRQGLHPTEACRRVITELTERCQQANETIPQATGLGDISLIALDVNGRFGAASNKQQFVYAVASDQQEPHALTYVR